MARIVSFVVLAAILLFIGGLFFWVMAEFLLPMFLAVLLMIMFGPLHRWILNKCKGHVRVAAGLTTAAILLIFLVPLLLILLQAVNEAVKLHNSGALGKLDISSMADYVAGVSSRLGMETTGEELQKTVIAKLQEVLGPIALSTTQYLGKMAMGLLVMVFSLYYFLADGPDMVRALMRLSPLDPRYQQELMNQFDVLTRSVVVATLASAFAQGILAGIGFYFAGLESIFLLIVLTMLMSMVPFVGAISVWVPACLYLYFSKGETGAAIGLAIYGALIVSTVDNIVKPMILHGQAKLHPLLALLSVLGGLQTLGPIGIFVGPMAVAFLQTLLNIFRNEVESMGDGK